VTLGLYRLILLAIWGILRFLPRIDPKRANYATFQSTYDLVVNLVLTVVLIIQGAAIAAAFGVPHGVVRVLPLVLDERCMASCRPSAWRRLPLPGLPPARLRSRPERRSAPQIPRSPSGRTPGQLGGELAD
jgi:hypothetical protein